MANIESVKLPNGSEYNIKDAISGYALQSEMSVTDGTGSDADKTTIQLKSGTSATVLKTHQSISGKADKVTGATNGNLASLDGNGNLTDAGIALNVSSPTNGQVMSYNGTSGKWENATMDLSSKVDKTDISSIVTTGATNTTGATITAGTYFYLNGDLVKAKADIANGATYTSGTNYNAVTVGDQLTALNNAIDKGRVSVTSDGIKTVAQLLNELYYALDQSKITTKSTFQYNDQTSQITTYSPGYGFAFSRLSTAGTDVNFEIYWLYKDNNSLYYAARATSSYTDMSSTVIPSGRKYIVNY